MENSTFSSTPFSSVKNLPDGVVNEAAASAHGAVDRFASSADAATRSVKPALERAAQVAHDTVNKVAEVARPSAAWLSQQSENLQTTGRNAAVDARAYVVAHPWQSVAGGLAAGFLIGRLTR